MSSKDGKRKINDFGVVENVDLTLEDWSTRWDVNFINFHKSTPDEDLIKHENLLITKEKSRVFIPLCGKTVDLVYLADKGHEVVGLEFTEKAVLDFFEENLIEFEKSQIKPFDVYKAKEKDITIFKGDFFDATPKVLGKFDVIWDQGSFVAINVKDRPNYVKTISAMLNSKGRHLLITYIYDATKFVGPPYTITDDEFESLFNEVGMEIKKLDEYSWDSHHVKEFGLEKLNIKVFLLTLV